MLKTRILLKTDASKAGEAWSDGEIAEALDTSIDTIARTRQQLVEGGLDAALTRKHSSNSARKRIFDGAAEAKLIALACSAPPEGFTGVPGLGRPPGRYPTALALPCSCSFAAIGVATAVPGTPLHSLASTSGAFA